MLIQLTCVVFTYLLISTNCPFSNETSCS